ncbi:MAG: O-antigen ligase family protein, partial [Bacteroidia bacterium]|nr:O-antigen ligase family protein [Bacteroidia bacterium]
MPESKQQALGAIIFALFIACIPLVQFTSLADPSLLSRQVYIAIILTLGLLLAIGNKQNSLNNLPKLYLGLGLLWFLSAIIGIFYAHNIPEVWYTSSKIALYVSAMWLMYMVVNTTTVSIRFISIGISMASLISLALLAFEILEKQKAGTHLWEQKNLYELQSAFGHKNLYASFQLLCLPFIFYLVQTEKKVLRYAATALLLLALASIGLIQTKSVILGLGIAMIFALPVAGTLLLRQQKRTLILLIIGYLSLLVGTALFIYATQDKFTLLLSNDTIRERILLWNNTFEMIKEFAPIGVGAGNWQVYFPKYGLGEFMQTNYLISDGYTTFQRPHSDFLWVLSELGVLGLLSYLGIFVYVLINGIKSFRSRELVQEKLFLLGLICTILAYIFVAMVDFPLERNEHQFVLAILFSILIGSDRKKEVITTKQKTIFYGITIALLVFTLGYGINRIPNEQHSKRIVMAQATGNWNKIITEAKKIDESKYNLDNFSIPISWYEGLAHYSLNNAEMAKKCFSKAYQVNPYQVHVLNNMAGIQEQEGNHEMALKYYNELLSISPSQPDAILNKSAVLFNQKKNAEAMECLYQFKYDEGNAQFIQFLKAIGYAYLREELTKLPAAQNTSALNSIEDTEFILHYFKWN